MLSDLAVPLLAAALAFGGAGGASSPAPIYLTYARVGDGIRVEVHGSSQARYEATFTLEVSSDPAGGGNRTLNRGQARLEPGVPVTLVTVMLGDVGAGRWQARLKVEPFDAPAYEDVQSSP